MFTGIVEELAQIKSIKPRKKGIRYSISADFVMDDIKIGDSISVNGVCLTIVETKKKYFCMDLVEETLNKSNLGELKVGDFINLERAMKATSRFGGHIVQGHVETVGVILEKQMQDEEAILSVGIDPEWMRFCIPKGSITLDGVSLTIAKINGNIIEVALIPHTIKNTTLGIKGKTDTLNIETDIIGKYIDRLLSFDADEEEIDTKSSKLYGISNMEKAENKLNIKEALRQFKNGKMLIVVDDEDRENEGDFIIAAEKATPEDINFMMKIGRGLICMPITPDHSRRLNLNPMVSDNTSIHETNFTVSVDAYENTTTGISAKDRWQTVQVILDEKSSPCLLYTSDAADE